MTLPPVSSVSLPIVKWVAARGESGFVIIAVYSSKGGVGKTTLASDLAYRFARMAHKRTLLWDLDTEGGSGFLLGADEAQKIKSTHFLERPSSLLNHVQSTVHKNLHYSGLGSQLDPLASNLRQLGPRQRLREALNYVARSFDRLVLDCPPVRNEMSRQVLLAADLLLVPLPVSPLASRALHHVQADLSALNRSQLPLLPIFSMFDSRRSAHQSAREDWMKPFPTVPYCTDIEQIAFRRRCIDEFAPQSDGSQALNKLWRGVEKRIRDDQKKGAGRPDGKVVPIRA